MKKIGIIIMVSSFISFFLAAGSYAQRGMKWHGSGGWGPGAQYNTMYSTETIETISGDVVSVDKVTPRKGMSYGVHLIVKTGMEDISVHLGPGWYIENQDTKLETGDKVVIKGSRISFEGKPAIIAAEVKKGTAVLTLRDESGFPVWAGWRRR